MNSIPLAVLIPIVAILVTAGVWLINRSLTQEGRLSSVETKTNVFWKIVEANALTILHHDDRPELDAVIDKRKQALGNGMDKEEAQHYIVKLQDAIANTDLSPGDRMAATMALAAAVARQAEPPKRRPFWKLW